MAVLGVAAVGYIGSHHIVQTRSGLRAYPKAAFGFSNSYVDMTRLGVTGLAFHLPVAAAMVAAGDLELVPGGRTAVRALEAGARVVDAIDAVDQRYGISQSAEGLGQAATERYDQINDRYQVEDKAAKAADATAKAAVRGVDAVAKWLRP